MFSRKWDAPKFILISRDVNARFFGNCRWLNNASLEKADLYVMNLNVVKLMNANLRESRIMFVKLRDADLLMADLNSSWLTSVNLGGANLTSANLSETRLIAVNFSTADLSGTNLNGVKFGCYEYTNTNPYLRVCTNLKDIKWNKDTNWQGIQGWETVENIPPALKQQLGLKE